MPFYLENVENTAMYVHFVRYHGDCPLWNLVILLDTQKLPNIIAAYVYDVKLKLHEIP